MPLAQPPDNATPTKSPNGNGPAENACAWHKGKYLFRVQDRRLTTGIIVEKWRLAVESPLKTKIEGRKADPVPGSEQELRAPMFVSSIGSVPEKLSGST